MAVVLELAYFVLLVFFILLIARLVFDYVMMFARSWRPSGVAAVGLEVVYSVTDPPLKALRRVIPPLPGKATNQQVVDQIKELSKYIARIPG